MFPHLMGKFVDEELNPMAVGFLSKAGFAPAEAWVYLSACVESLSGIALVVEIWPCFAALAAGGALLVDAYALHMVNTPISSLRMTSQSL